MGESPSRTLTFAEVCKDLRGEILSLADEIKGLHQHPIFTDEVPPSAALADFSEMHANVTLAYRHLEDARMRLGKAVQASDGGKSVYDR